MLDKTSYICFLQDLAMSRDKVRAQLRELGCKHEPIWFHDQGAASLFDLVEIVVTAEHKVGKDELKHFKNLKMLSLAFTGHDEVDLAYCNKKDLHVYFVPGYSTDSVAELTTTMAACLYRRLPLIDRRIRTAHWDRTPPGLDKETPGSWPGRELRGSLVGIIGTGEIGLRVAEIFHRGFGCRLIGWAHRNQRPEFLNLGGVYCNDIDDVFAQADIVCLHVQLNEQTRRIANRKRLELMKRDSVLLNTARTGLVDLQALAEVLRDRPYMGAGLDVTYEKELTTELLGLENIVLTPHIGFRTNWALSNLAKLAIQNIGDYLFPSHPSRLAAPLTKPSE